MSELLMVPPLDAVDLDLEQEESLERDAADDSETVHTVVQVDGEDRDTLAALRHLVDQAIIARNNARDALVLSEHASAGIRTEYHGHLRKALDKNAPDDLIAVLADEASGGMFDFSADDGAIHVWHQGKAAALPDPE